MAATSSSTASAATRNTAVTENPYAAVHDVVLDKSMGQAVRVDSPTQVACGACLGGPIGLVCFLWANFAAPGDGFNARKTLIYGAFFTSVLIMQLPFLPENLSTHEVQCMAVTEPKWGSYEQFVPH